jgi:hypothetical protein
MIAGQVLYLLSHSLAFRAHFLLKPVPNWTSVQCPEVPEFVYPLPIKYIWVSSKYWQLQINLLINPCVLIFVWTQIFIIFGWILAILKAGIYGKNIFSFVRTYQIVSQNIYAILHFCEQWMRVPIVPYSHQHLMFVFWIWVL